MVEVDAAGSDGAQLWIVDLARRLATPLTGENEDTPFPAWTSDSQLVVYRSNRGGRLGIYRLPADGSSDPELLLEMLAVVGFYHLVSFTANALRLHPEPYAARFPA